MSTPRKSRSKAGGGKKTPASKTAAAKKAAAKQTPPVDETPQVAPIELEAPDGVGKGELRDSITHFGVYYPAGTKASDVKPALSGDDKDRLKRLGVLA